MKMLLGCRRRRCEAPRQSGSVDSEKSAGLRSSGSIRCCGTRYYPSAASFSCQQLV